jgi:hypothetical protein
MKIWAFVKWHYKKLEFWQKFFLVGFFAMGWGFASPSHSTEEFVAYMVALTSINCVFFKWFVWDPMKDSYRKFQKEQHELFNTIKHSHKK